MSTISRCTILLGLLISCWAVEGSWAATGRRAVYGAPKAILLDTGKVLSLGASSTGWSTYCELYDPDLGTWSPTGSLLLAPDSPYNGLTPVRLRNGKVLVIRFRGSGISSCELYDPDTGTWSRTGSLAQELSEPMAFCLDSGKVIRVGGWDVVRGHPSRTFELFDPQVGVWVESGVIPHIDVVASAVLLPSGQVLVIGTSGNWNGSRECQLYDPISNTWSSTGTMSRELSWIVPAVLPSGDVLVSGGGASSGATADCELYDHTTGTWRQVGSLAGPRIYHMSVVLATGKVLVYGGWGNTGELDTCELFDPATSLWTTVAPTLSLSFGQGLYQPGLTLPTSGKVFVTDWSGTCELFSGPLDRPLVSVPPHTIDPTPSWSWMPSGGGNGTFRWRLDDSDLTSGSSQGADCTFTPSAPLADGRHTLYVQERNDAGDWSASGSSTVVVDLNPPSVVLAVSAATVGYGSTVMLTVTFSEPVVGFAAEKLSASNATVGTTIASADQQTFSVPMTIGPPGPVHVLLPAYSVTDLGGHFLVTDATLDLTAVVGPSTPGTSEISSGGGGGCGVGGATGILLGILCMAGFRRSLWMDDLKGYGWWNDYNLKPNPSLEKE